MAFSQSSQPISAIPTREPNFNHIARPYRWLEYLTLGRSLERCRLHFLPRLAPHRQALILGDGDGRFLAQLLAINPHLHADAVDTSSSMLQLLRRNCETAAPNTSLRLETHHTSALHFTPAKPCDLIVTHFFLDCLTQSELDLLITRLTPTLTPQATWLISDFRIPAGPLRLTARMFLRSLYFVFRLLTGLRTNRLPDYATPLTRTGWIRISYHHSLGGLLTTELWQTQANERKAPS